MNDKSSIQLLAPIILGLLMAAGLGIGLRYDLNQPHETNVVRPAKQAPREIWRCHACARLRGKSWTPCKTVTGRGTKLAAQDLVKQRVCSEADDPENGCRITKLDCRQLTEEDIAPAKGVRVRME